MVTPPPPAPPTTPVSDEEPSDKLPLCMCRRCVAVLACMSGEWHLTASRTSRLDVDAHSTLSTTYARLNSARELNTCWPLTLLCGVVGVVRVDVAWATRFGSKTCGCFLYKLKMKFHSSSPPPPPPPVDEDELLSFAIAVVVAVAVVAVAVEALAVVLLRIKCILGKRTSCS